VGDSTGDVTTHVCAYSAAIDYTSNKVVSADLVNVDNKCLSHFENMLTLDNVAVTKHNDMESHDANVRLIMPWWVLMPLGLFVAIHNHHAVAKELEPVR
jgi:hypothetical protein